MSRQASHSSTSTSSLGGSGGSSGSNHLSHSSGVAVAGGGAGGGAGAGAFVPPAPGSHTLHLTRMPTEELAYRMNAGASTTVLER